VNFAEELKQASKLVLSEAEEDSKAITIKLFNSIIQDTPVGNPDLWVSKKKPKNYVGGRARGNWQCSIGTPKTNDIDRKDKDGSAAQAEVLDSVLSLPPEGAVYLSNNLPYAQPLEFGHSGQAPAGMVRKNMARIKQILRETLSKK